MTDAEAAGFRPFESRQFQGTYARYRTVAAMGSGSYGFTFEAEVLALAGEAESESASGLEVGSRVVIKVPRIDPSRSHDANIDRLKETHGTFIADFEALAKLKDAISVAHVLDHGVFSLPLDEKITAPALFFVQELIVGERLDEYLKRVYGRGRKRFAGIPNADEFFAWATKLVVAVQQVHQRDVVHGDIWPENIIVTPEEHPILIDFGQALLRSLLPPRQRPTRDHPYLAPEGRGAVSGDIYSLGAVLHYLATGSPPKERAPDNAVLKELVTGSIRRLNSGLYNDNPGIADIIARCLRHTEESRASGTEDVLQDIQDFCGHADGGSSRTIVSVDEINNPLFRVMANRMLRKLTQTLIDMSEGFAEIAGDRDELVRGLLEYLSILDEGDSYWTLSEPQLWRPENLGINSRFLTMNQLAALRGATIRRVFMVTPEELNDVQVGEVIRAHAAAIEHLAELGILSAKDFDAGGYWAGYCVIDEKKRKLEERKRSHFGLLRHSGSEIWVSPVYRANGTLLTLQFNARHSRAESLRAYFHEQLDAAQPLRQFPTENPT